MIKRITSLFLVLITILSMLPTASFAEEEIYGYFNVYYTDTDETGTVEALRQDDVIYVNADYYKSFGFSVTEKEGFVCISNTEKDTLPQGAVAFYYNAAECCRVNEASVESYPSPAKPIRNEKGIWIPFDYSMRILNGCLLPHDGTLYISAPCPGLFDLLHYISSNSQKYSFDYAKDFGYGKFTENFLTSTSHFVNVFSGLLKWDIYSWSSFINSGSITSWFIGDAGYDTKYGNTVARMMCTNSFEEMLDTVKKVSVTSELLDEKGALGKFITEMSDTNETNIKNLLEESNKALENIKTNNTGVDEYNRIYKQLEQALDKSAFSDIGSVITEAQKATDTAAKGFKLLSLVAETVAYYSEFNSRDLFAVDSLERFAAELPYMHGDVSFYTKTALMQGAADFRQDAVSYSLGRLVKENIGEVISEGINLCAKANLVLFAWDIASACIPFLSNSLKATDSFELSVYSTVIQNEALRIYNEKAVSMMSTDGHLSADELKELSLYAYAYLKLCYISRNAASDGIMVLTKKAEEASEILKADLTETNAAIAPLLSLAKKSFSNTEFSDFLYEDTVSYVDNHNDKALLNIFKEGKIESETSWKQAYMDILGSTDLKSYALYDIDKDGTPELLLNDYSGGFECFVYSYNGKETVEYGNILNKYGIYGHDGNGIIYSTGGTGILCYSVCKMDNGTLTEEDTPLLLRSVHPSEGIEEYKYKGKNISSAEYEEKENEIKEKEIEFCAVTDLSLFGQKTEANANLLFLDVIADYEQSYGKIAVTEQSIGTGNLYSDSIEMLSGLCYAELIDFNNDGNDELIVCYDSDLNSDGGYCADVWAIINGASKKVYSTAAVIAGQDYGYYSLDIYNENGTYIMQKKISDDDYYEGASVTVYSIFDGQKFIEKDSVKIIWNSDPYTTDYEINGIPCSQDDYWAHYEEMQSNNFRKLEFRPEHFDFNSEKIKETVYKLGGIQNDTKEDVWTSFIEDEEYYEYFNSGSDTTEIKYTLYDLDLDGTDELLIMTGKPSWHTTYLFRISNGEIIKVYDSFGYGQYRYSPQYTSLQISPELKPFSGAGAWGFYKLTDDNLEYNFTIIEDIDGYYYSDNTGKKEIDNAPEYFSDLVYFDWVTV